MKDKNKKLKEKLGDEEVAQIIEEVVEEKVEKRVQQRIEKKEEGKEQGEVSRRDFIKKIGLGTLGLGAASLIPSTSALDIKDSEGLNVYQGGNQYLDVDSTSVSIHGNAQLDLGDSRITNVADPDNPSDVATQGWVNDTTTSFSGSYNDLTNVPNTFTPENHDNSAHTTNYIPELVGADIPVYSSQSNVPSSITEGELVYISGDGVYVEDGT